MFTLCTATQVGPIWPSLLRRSTSWFAARKRETDDWSLPPFDLLLAKIWYIPWKGCSTHILKTNCVSSLWKSSETSSKREDSWFIKGANLRLGTSSRYRETATFAVLMSDLSSQSAQKRRASLL